MGTNSAMGNGGTTLLGGNLTVMGGLGGTGGLGPLGINNQNSHMGESELDIEFGYCSEEESIF